MVFIVLPKNLSFWFNLNKSSAPRICLIYPSHVRILGDQKLAKVVWTDLQLGQCHHFWDSHSFGARWISHVFPIWSPDQRFFYWDFSCSREWNCSGKVSSDSTIIKLGSFYFRIRLIKCIAKGVGSNTNFQTLYALEYTVSKFPIKSLPTMHILLLNAIMNN